MFVDNDFGEDFEDGFEYEDDDEKKSDKDIFENSRTKD